MFIQDELSDRLRQVYAEILGNEPHPTVVVLEYPQLFTENATSVCNEADFLFFEFSMAEQQFIRDMTDLANQVIQQIAAEVGVHVASASGFEGHELCGPEDDWMYGISIPLLHGWGHKFHRRTLHPNQDGHDAAAQAVNEHLATLRGSGWPLHDNLLPENPPPMGTLAAATTSSVILPVVDALAVEIPGASCAGGDLVASAGQVHLRGSGFAAGADVEISLKSATFEGVVGSVQADGAGELDATLTLPSISTVPEMPAALFEARGQGANGAGLLLMSDVVALVDSTSTDSDADGLPDVCDNCPGVANADQTDGDFDGLGDSCDPNPTDPDTFAPSITDRVRRVRATSADLLWSTNEDTPSVIHFGLAAGEYTDTVEDLAPKTSHMLQLQGLTKNTTYHYEIVATDAAGNSTTTGNLAFKTSKPSSGCGLLGLEPLVVFLGLWFLRTRRRSAAS